MHNLHAVNLFVWSFQPPLAAIQSPQIFAASESSASRGFHVLGFQFLDKEAAKMPSMISVDHYTILWFVLL